MTTIAGITWITGIITGITGFRYVAQGGITLKPQNIPQTLLIKHQALFSNIQHSHIKVDDTMLVKDFTHTSAHDSLNLNLTDPHASLFSWRSRIQIMTRRYQHLDGDRPLVHHPWHPSPDKRHTSLGTGGVGVVFVVWLWTVEVGMGWNLYVVCLLSRYEFCQGHFRQES